MKNIARLFLFFSFCFAVVFITAVLLRFISTWIDFARIIPQEHVSGEYAAEAAWKALPAAVYLSILLTLSYSARRNMPIPLSLICILVLGVGFTIGASLGISRAEALKPVLRPQNPVRGAPGLILSQSENSVILLKESADIQGPRVVSIPGRPLIYQEAPRGPNNTIPGLPALAFGDETPWFIRSLGIDFSLCAGELKSRFGADFILFAVYVFSLVLLLGSLRFLVELSEWPLANLFLGALVFRGILALEIFLNAREINALIGSYLAGRAPPTLITPLVFCALGALVIIYTLLVHIARSKRGRDG
jgi:hypothetical protein